MPPGPDTVGGATLDDRRIVVRRVYDPAQPGEGRRVLVDRLWPDVDHSGAAVLREHLASRSR